VHCVTSRQPFGGGHPDLYLAFSCHFGSPVRLV